MSNAFRQLGERFEQQGLKKLKGIFTDTCCKWASKLADIFPGVPVKLDLFHAIQRFTSSIHKRKQYYAEITRDYSLVFRAPTDLGEKRLDNTPDSHVLLQNIKKFEKKWQHVKYNNDENVLNANAIKEMKNIKVHIRKGCLSGIAPGCGTNRNERLNRHLNKFLLNNKISVSLAYARCFRLFSKLKCMDTIAKNMFTSGSPSLAGDSTEEYLNDGNSHARLESFALDNACILGKGEDIEREQSQLNINMFSESSVMEIARNIQALLAEKQKQSLSLVEPDKNFIEHDYASVEGEVEVKDQTNSLNILHNAICLWRTYIQLSKMFGNKVVDYETIGISNTKSELSVDFTPDKEEPVPLNSAPNPNPQDGALEHIASAWGLEVVDIPGDGNCFFTAVAFHLHQLISDTSTESSIAQSHLESIGINREQTIPNLANFLRRLVVDEWTGPFRSEYQAFLTDAAIEDEAQRFLTNGHYITSLGDAMPLAMANVLQLPILIFVPYSLVPFTTIFPRYNVDCIPPLLLAYENDGPGHYDALIPSKHGLSGSSINDDSAVGEIDDARNILHIDDDKSKCKPRNYCRCGINKKREHVEKRKTPRKYKSRCGCLISFLRCSQHCRCNGACGGTACKDTVTVQDSAPTNSRQTRKRGQNPIKTSPHKKMKISATKHETPNALEYFIIVSIVNYFSVLCLFHDTKEVANLYNDIVAIVAAETSLEMLPVQARSRQRIERVVRRIKKKTNQSCKN